MPLSARSALEGLEGYQKGVSGYPLEILEGLLPSLGPLKPCTQIAPPLLSLEGGGRWRSASARAPRAN
jgi:hypothetical protein